MEFQRAAKPGDVTLRGSAEELLILAAKIRWVFIAYAEPGARCVQVFAEHQAACLLKSYLLLKLQRTNEELVGEALAPLRGQVEIATKFGFKLDPTAERGMAGLDSRPEHIKEVADASLKRLRVD